MDGSDRSSVLSSQASHDLNFHLFLLILDGPQPRWHLNLGSTSTNSTQFHHILDLLSALYFSSFPLLILGVDPRVGGGEWGDCPPKKQKMKCFFDNIKLFDKQKQKKGYLFLFLSCHPNIGKSF